MHIVNSERQLFASNGRTFLTACGETLLTAYVVSSTTTSHSLAALFTHRIFCLLKLLFSALF